MRLLMLMKQMIYDMCGFKNLVNLKITRANYILLSTLLKDEIKIVHYKLSFSYNNVQSINIK